MKDSLREECNIQRSKGHFERYVPCTLAGRKYIHHHRSGGFGAAPGAPDKILGDQMAGAVVVLDKIPAPPGPRRALRRSPGSSPKASFLGIDLGHLGALDIAFLRPSAAKNGDEQDPWMSKIDPKKKALGEPPKKPLRFPPKTR